MQRLRELRRAMVYFRRPLAELRDFWTQSIPERNYTPASLEKGHPKS